MMNMNSDNQRLRDYQFNIRVIQRCNKSEDGATRYY